MNINDAVEMHNTLTGNSFTDAQKVLIDAYIKCVLEEEHNHDFNKISRLTDMFEELLNELS